MAVTMNIIVFWDVTSCIFWPFRGTCFPHYPTTRPHCVKSQNTALVRVPYVSLCVTSVGLVCPHCEDMPNVDSHSVVRIHVAVLVVGYLWPLAAKCTKLQILFCFFFLKADGHFWCPVCSKSTFTETADKFPLSWKTFNFPCKLPCLRIISISVHMYLYFLDWNRYKIRIFSFLLKLIVMTQFSFYIFCDSVRVERFAVKKLYKVACLLLSWLRKYLFAWRRKAIQVLKLSPLGFTSW